MSIDQMEIKCNELLEAIEKGCEEAKQKRRILKSLDTATKKSVSIDFNIESEVKQTSIEDVNGDSFDFEGFVSLYLNDYKKLDINCTVEDIINILPSKSNYYFTDLIYRLKAESIREIKELKSLDVNDSSLSEEDLREYNELLQTEKRKISLLSDVLSLKENTNTETKEEVNHLVLVPTTGGNIRILEDLKKIPNDFYSSFLELIKSIETGEFQGLKKLTNNGNVESIYEVKGSMVRVLFSRLSSNHYALITCFLKKVDWDNYYNSIISNASSLFNRSEEVLREQLSNEEFMKQNDLYVEELFRVLGSSDKKEYKKGGLNG